jgi:ParB-like chromosome segregation protein Spo0J
MASGTPLDPILVYLVGERFYVMDGHHRLAAYDTAKWTGNIPVRRAAAAAVY